MLSEHPCVQQAQAPRLAATRLQARLFGDDSGGARLAWRCGRHPRLAPLHSPAVAVQLAAQGERAGVDTGECGRRVGFWGAGRAVMRGAERACRGHWGPCVVTHTDAYQPPLGLPSTVWGR